MQDSKIVKYICKHDNILYSIFHNTVIHCSDNHMSMNDSVPNSITLHTFI